MNYFQIKINNATLDLYENVKAKFDYSNPAFRFSGGRSLPFTIPKTARNLTLTGYIDRFDVAVQKAENATIWLGGVVWDFGVIKMRAASERSIEIYFEQTEADLLKEMETLFIKSAMDVLNIGTPSWFAIFDITGNIAATEDQTYTIVIDGKLYSYTAVLFSGATKNTVFNALKTAINADYAGMATHTGGVFKLQGTTAYSIEIVDAPGFAITSSQSYESSVQNIWTNYLNTANVDSLVFPSIVNWKLYPDNTDWDGIINDYTNNAYIVNNTPQSKQNEFNNTIVPFVLLSKVFAAIESLYNLQFTGSFWNTTDIQNLFFVHNQTIDDANKHKQMFGDNYVNVFETTFSTGRFVPDMTAKELIDGFSMLFGLAFYWSEVYRTWTPKPKTDLLNTSIEDWTTKAAKTYKATFAVRQGYKIAYENDKNDTTSNIHNQPIIVGDGAAEYVLPIASPVQRAIFTDDGMKSMPYLEQLNTGEFSPRVAVYKGIAQSNTGINYPKAEALSLEGIHTSYWQTWATFLNNAKIIQKEFQLNINDLLQIRTFESPMKMIKSENGTVVGMVSGFSFEADIYGVSLVDVEMYSKDL